MNSIAAQVADIKRRLLGLKASRAATLSQVKVFEETYPFNLILQPNPSAGYYAKFHLEVVCTGVPLVSAGLSDYDLFPIVIKPSPINWIASGNTASCDIFATNSTGSIINVNVSVKVWALNGISATCVRTV